MQTRQTKTPDRVTGGNVAHMAMFLPSLVGGGAERVFLTLAEHFLDQGMRVDLVAAGVFGDLVSQVDPRIRLFNLGQPRVLSAVPGLVRYLRGEKPPVLLSGLTHANLIAILANRLAGSPARLIVTEHLSLQVNAGLKHRLLYPIAKYLYPRASAIVAVSEGVAEDLRKLIGPDVRLTVIYNPINLERITRMSLEAPSHPWLIEKDRPVLLAVGRLHPNKDFDTLLKAFSHLVRRRPARLIILGQGEEKAALQALASELQVEAHVSMPGFVKNPYPFMRLSDVFVVSSIYEGLSMVLIEALACGATIVSTDCPSGPAEILNNGEFGRLVPVKNTQVLSDAILEAIDHPSSVDAILERAACFDIPHISARYLELVQQVLNED